VGTKKLKPEESLNPELRDLYHGEHGERREKIISVSSVSSVVKIKLRG
jgi:hypothetical protein